MTTQLINAAGGNKKEEIQKCINEGTNINSTTDSTYYGIFPSCRKKYIANSSAFMEACAYGHLELAKWLITQEADFNYTNPQGYNAAHVAAFMGQQEVLDYLLHTLNFDLGQEDKDGYNVYQAAAAGKASADYKWLARINRQDNDKLQASNYTGYSGLNDAVMQEDLPAVRYFIEFKGHSPNQLYNYENQSPYEMAKQSGHREIVEYFDSLGNEKLKNQKLSPDHNTYKFFSQVEKEESKDFDLIKLDEDLNKLQEEFSLKDVKNR